MKSIPLNRIGQFILFAMFTYSIGKAIVFNPGATFGGWMYNLVPAAVFGVLLLFWVTDSISPPWQWSFLPRFIKRNEFVLVLIISLVLTIPFSVIILKHPSITYVLSFLLVTGGILTACFLISIGKQAWGLAVLIVSLPIIQFLEYEFRGMVKDILIQGPFYVTPSLIVIFLVGLVSGLKQLLDKQTLIFSSIHKAWLFLLIPMLVSATFSIDRLTSFRSVTYFLIISILFFLAVQSIKTVEDVKLCSVALGLAATMRIGTFLYFQVAHIAGGITEWLSFFGLAPIMGSVSWGAVGCVLFLGGWVLSENLSLIKKFSIGLIVLVIILSFPVLPRSTIVAFIPALMGFIFIRRARLWVLSAIIIGAIIFAIWSPFLLENTALGRFQQFASWGSLLDSQKQRLDTWEAAWLMMKDYPWTGIGPGMWLEYLPKYGSSVIYNLSSGYVISGAHSPYLHSGATAGILGFISVIVFTIVTFWEAISLYLRERHSSLAPLAMSFVSLTVFYWIFQILGGGGFEPHFFIDAKYMPWLIFGLMIAWKKAENGTEEN